VTGLWEVVAPQATKNYIPNPSVELNTTGYANLSSGTAAGTNTRLVTNAAYGFFAYQLVKSSGAGNWGTHVALTDVTEVLTGSSITFSVWLKVPTGVTVTLFGDLEASSTYTATLEVVGPAEGRYSITVGPITGTLSSGYLEVYFTQNGTVYIDGLMAEVGTVQTTYCDGDQDGCYWEGVHHNGGSSRHAYSRAGGLPTNFDSFAFYITDLQGVGMPRLRARIDDLPLQDVGLFQDLTVDARTLTLIGVLIGTSLSDLHAKRRALINLLKSDRGPTKEPVILRYTGATIRVQIKAYFVDGLSYGRRAGFTETLALQFVCEDPFWTKDYAVTASLPTGQTLSAVYRLLQRLDGVWSKVGGANALSNSVRCLALRPDRDYYVGGLFTVAGATTLNRIAHYHRDTDTFTDLGATPGANGNVYAMVLAPDGTLYVGGAFTLMDGIANTNRIAMWTTDNDAFALGTGMNGDVYALALAPNGDLYAAGDFTTAGGVAAAGIAKWNGSAWSAVGANTVVGGRALAIGIDSRIYIGGTFANMGNVAAADNLAQYTGSAWAAIGSAGPNAEVDALLIARNGDLYIGGQFTTVGGITANYIARWNRANWEALPEEPNNTVYGFLERSDGLYFVGSFTGLGGRAGPDEYGIFTGVGMVWGDADIAWASVETRAIAGDDTDLIIGSEGTGTAYVAVPTTVTNPGTRAAYPVLYVTHDGSNAHTHLWLENYTSRKRIYLHFTTVNGERVTLDLRPKTRSMRSNLYGNAWRSVLRGSDLTAFTILPGDNTINYFADGAPTSAIQIALQFVPAYWSLDGADA
jgi:hypothetical protein